MLLIPETDHPTPAMPLPLLLLYVSATSGCMPPRPGGTSMGTRYVAAPPSVEGVPGIVPTQPWAGADGATTAWSAIVVSHETTSTLFAPVYPLQPDGLQARTRYQNLLP